MSLIYFRNCLIAIHCDGHILISFVFPQFTSLHSVLHSFHGLMNSINWPASSVWVFIAQLGEHCSANAEATGSNPVEAPKIFFSGYFRNCLNCDSLRWSHTHFNNDSIVKQSFLMSKNLHSINNSGFYSNFINSIEHYHLPNFDPESLDNDRIRRYTTNMKKKYIYLSGDTAWNIQEN